MNHQQHHQPYNKFRKETPKTKNHPKSNNENNNNNNDRFSSVKNSLQTCMGFMDGLCCASLNQVSADDREEKSRAHLRDFMASYDLSYLNSNFGDANSATGSSSSNSSNGNSSSGNSEQQGSTMNHPAPASGFPSVEKGGTTYQKSTTPSSPTMMMHNVLPTSMLPRDYGHSEGSPTTNTEDHQHQDNEVNSCCQSFSQFHGMNDCQHDSSYAQPRTLPSADTYTTVSLSQSYTTMMWDDDDDEEEDISSDYVLSPVDSVFRKDEHMEEASMERDGPPSCSPTASPSSSSFPTSSSIATKTHEAYQYLLRMKPQNYLHGSGSSSSEDLEQYQCGGAGELDEHYCHSNSNNNNRTNTSILGGDVNHHHHQCGPLVFLQ